MEYGQNVLPQAIILHARDYPDANAYIAGLSAQTTECLVTPVVFYHVDKK